jgi:Protein of unknown function (DUF2778)
MHLISAGIAALAFGALLGSQIRISAAGNETFQTVPVSRIEKKESSPEPASPRASFDERFAGADASPAGVSERTVEAALKVEDSVGNDVAPLPQRAAADPAVRHSAPQLAPDSPSLLAGGPKQRLRTSDLSMDSTSPSSIDNHTAIYDIAAHTVYLPDGQRLEAHSGLGDYIDNARYVNVKGRGATPPNIYDLALRDQIFHGVRAIRLIPVDEAKMFGRDGMLAHSYMLGPNGQSNGCVSFSDYPTFLNAFLRGDVSRLIVVEHLTTAPAPATASGWVPDAIKDLFVFGRS